MSVYDAATRAWMELMSNRVTFLEGQVAGMGSRLDAHETFYRTGKPIPFNTEAPSPEQAQEIEVSALDKEIADWAIPRQAFPPPEQARRTWEIRRSIRLPGPRVGADEVVTAVELRPGERIVSGEGVLECQPMPLAGGWFPCGQGATCENPQRRVIVFPDAPPRAEGE